MTSELGAAPRLRVLAADHFPDTADTMAALVRAWGHECDVAYDGDEALQAIEERWHDVILCDIAMPRTNGFDLAMNIRRRFGRLPLLIAVTGRVSLEDRLRAWQCGFDHFVTKPADPAQLRRLLENPVEG